MRDNFLLRFLKAFLKFRKNLLLSYDKWLNRETKKWLKEKGQREFASVEEEEAFKKRLVMKKGLTIYILFVFVGMLLMMILKGL